MTLSLYADRDELSRALQRASTVVDRKATIPLCACVLLDATDSGVQLTATDTEIAYVGELTANVETPGTIATDARALLAAVRSLPDPTVRLAVVRAGRLELRSGAVVYELPTLPADDFPPLPTAPDGEAIVLPSAELRRLVVSTTYAVAQDDVRYGLNGAHVEVVAAPAAPAPGTTRAAPTAPAAALRLRMVATDGHRLGLAETPIVAAPSIPPRTLIPRKALAALRKLLDGDSDVVVQWGNGSLRVGLARERLWCRLLDGEFPDYSAVIPVSSLTTATVGRAELTAAVARARVVSDTGALVALQGADTVAVSAESVDAGRVHETLAAQVAGEPVTIKLSPAYAADALGALAGERVRIETTGPLAPCVLRDPERDDVLCVVMPLRQE